MRRRLRKLYRIGEFTEYGFEVVVPTAFASDKALDALIAFVESRNLGCGGSTRGAYIARLRGTAPLTDEDRVAFLAFCEAHGWPCEVRPFTDAHWADFEDGVWTSQKQPSSIRSRAK